MNQSKQNNLIKIIPFDEQYKDDFYRLNCQWLEKYFYIEDLDQAVLSDPLTHIIQPGGFIFLAIKDNKIIGTAALIVADDNKLELSKMSVDESYQGAGIGKKLAVAAINYYQQTNFSLLYLESNRILKPAIQLYLKLGFVEKPYPYEKSHYSRADIYMEYLPTGK